MTPAAILELLVGRKVFDGNAWHVYDADGNELADTGGVLWRGVMGALLMWPRPAPAVAPVLLGRRPKIDRRRENDEALLIALGML